MTTNPVGANGNVKTFFVSEARIQQEIAKLEKDDDKVKGGLFDGYTKKQLKELSNEAFNKALGLYTEKTFDEKTYNQTYLDKSKASKDVTETRYDSRTIYRQILEEELPKLDIDGIAGMFDGTKAIPSSKDESGKLVDNLSESVEAIANSAKQIGPTVKHAFHVSKNEDIAMSVAVEGISEDKLHNMIGFGDLSEKQKSLLQSNLKAASEKTLPELMQRFGINIDTSELADLTPEGTRADLEKQLELLNKILEQLPAESTTGNKNIFDQRIDQLDARLTQNYNEAKHLTEEIWGQQDKEVDAEGKLHKKRVDKAIASRDVAQDEWIADYTELKELELLKTALTNVRTSVKDLRDKLNVADRELIEIETYDASAAKRNKTLLNTEKQEYKAKVKAEVTETKDASRKVRDTRVAADRDKDTETGNTEYNNENKAETTAREARVKEGYNKNYSHVLQYIYDNQKGYDAYNKKDMTKISLEQADALKAALEGFKESDANVLDVIADFVKFDDASSDFASKKKVKKTGTDDSQIDADKMLFLLRYAKNILNGMPLETQSAKKAAKEVLNSFIGTEENNEAIGKVNDKVVTLKEKRAELEKAQQLQERDSDKETKLQEEIEQLQKDIAGLYPKSSEKKMMDWLEQKQTDAQAVVNKLTKELAKYQSTDDLTTQLSEKRAELDNLNKAKRKDFTKINNLKAEIADLEQKIGAGGAEKADPIQKATIEQQLEAAKQDQKSIEENIKATKALYKEYMGVPVPETASSKK